MNKVMLIGNVGKEPEVRYVDAGVCVASVRLATKERGYKLPNGGEVPDRTEWHNVILWRKLAEVVEKAIAANPKAVEDIRNGKGKAIGAIVGFVMKEMKGKCDPATVNKMISEKLGQ